MSLYLICYILWWNKIYMYLSAKYSLFKTLEIVDLSRDRYVKYLLLNIGSVCYFYQHRYRCFVKAALMNNHKKMFRKFNFTEKFKEKFVRPNQSNIKLKVMHINATCNKYISSQMTLTMFVGVVALCQQKYHNFHKHSQCPWLITICSWFIAHAS